MNKRTERTENLIYEGLTKALKVKSYAQITIQDILDNSGVSRSTFYAHFNTKDELLESICSRIFTHVFSHTLNEEKTHDFSKSSIFEYSHLITHIFYHIRDKRDLIDAIFLSQSKDIFVNKMKEELDEFAKACVNSNFISSKDIPINLHIKQFKENFIITLEYWQANNYLESPEQITDYFIKLN